METEFRELCGAEDLLQSFPLHRACRDGDLSTLAGLLGEAVVSVCDAAAQDPLFGWTPAHWAAHNGKVECLEILVKAGLPCDISTHGTGLTLAHVAALEGQSACLVWVCENGVSINAQDHMGETAAHKAVRCGSVECLHILKEHGANLSLRSSIGITVMELAVQNQQTQCIEYFKAGGDSHMTHHMTCTNGRRKRMQASEEAEIDLDPAKRARVEREELHHGISHPSRQQLDHMTMKEYQDIINRSGVASGVGSVGTSHPSYAATKEHHMNGDCSSTTRQQLDSMICNGTKDDINQSMVSGVGSVDTSKPMYGTKKHYHVNGYGGNSENSENRAIPIEEESNLSCWLQGADHMTAGAQNVDTMDMSCIEEQSTATDGNKLVDANDHHPVKSCVNSSAVTMTTHPDCTPKDYWMECYVPTPPVPKCRALSGHYL